MVSKHGVYKDSSKEHGVNEPNVGKSKKDQDFFNKHTWCSRIDVRKIQKAQDSKRFTKLLIP